MLEHYAIVFLFCTLLCSVIGFGYLMLGWLSVSFGCIPSFIAIFNIYTIEREFNDSFHSFSPTTNSIQVEVGHKNITQKRIQEEQKKNVLRSPQNFVNDLGFFG
jgi:hypothetical protein